MAKRKHSKVKRYGRRYFQNPFPPNHNPLIGTLQVDTLVNARDALYALQELTEHPEEVALTTNTTVGLHFLMTCVIDALQFEIKHRK